MKIDELLGKGGASDETGSSDGAGDVLSAIKRNDSKALKLAIKALVTECMAECETEEDDADEGED